MSGRRRSSTPHDTTHTTIFMLQAVFVDELGADPSCLSNATPKDDFGGGHADPNLTYAKDLVKAMGLTNKGAKDPESEGKKVRPVWCCC